MNTRCARIRTSISASLDGEATARESARAEHHLAVCASCAQWASDARLLTRRAAVSAAPEQPLVSRVALRAAHGRRALLPLGAWARTGLVSLGLVQIFLALTSIPHDGSHAAREMVAVDIALGLGALAVAARPARAAGMLPPLTVLSLLLLASSLVDLADGWTDVGRELPHLLVVGEWALAWRVGRAGAPVLRSPRPPGVEQSERRAA